MEKKMSATSSAGVVQLRFESVRNLTSPDEKKNGTRTYFANVPAVEILKLDTGHKYPQAEGLLAQIMIEKRNYAEAATHLRAYLGLVPNAKNADDLKQQLQKLEQASAEVKK